MSEENPNIIVASTGEPFKTEAAASSALQRQKLDQEIFSVMPHPTKVGYCIGNTVELQKPAKPPAQSGVTPPVDAPPAPGNEGAPSEITRNDLQQYGDLGEGEGVLASTRSETEYWLVRFHEKQHDQELDQFPLSVNNDVIAVSRGEEIVLPASYLEVAENARIPRWKTIPGQNRKVRSVVSRYPFTKIRKATRQEFVQRMREGNAQRDRDIVRQESEGQGIAAAHAAIAD